jgi:hypothetical protein
MELAKTSVFIKQIGHGLSKNFQCSQRVRLILTI